MQKFIIHIIQLEEALKKVKYDVIGLCEVKRESETIIGEKTQDYERNGEKRENLLSLKD